MNGLKDKNEVLEEAQSTLMTLYSNGTLPRNEEESRFLQIFRQLSETNKLIISSRIEGMLEAQTYVQMSGK